MSRTHTKWTAGLIAIVLMAMWLSASPAAAAGLSLTPNEGAPGSSFVVTGSGFEPGRNVKVRWDGSGFPGTVTVDDSGGFTVKLTVPGDASPGNHVVSAAETGRGQTARARFSVVAPPSSTTTVPTTTLPTTTTTPPTTTAPPTTAPPTTSPPTTTPAPTTTAAPGTTATTPAPPDEEATTSPTAAADSTGDARADDSTPDRAAASNPEPVESLGEAGALRVAPDQVAPGEAIVATFIAAGPVGGDVWIELDGRAVTPAQFVTEAEPVIFRFRAPEGLAPGTYALTAVTGEGPASRQLATTDLAVVEPGTGGSLLWPAVVVAALGLAGLALAWFLLAGKRRTRDPEDVDPSTAATTPVAAAETQAHPALVTAAGGWTRRIFDGGEPAATIDGVAAFSGRLFAVGALPHEASTSGAVWSSPDGSAWEQVADLGPGKATSLDATLHRLVVSGTLPSAEDHWEWGVWGSTDGEEWKPLLDGAKTRPRGAPLGVAVTADTLLVYGRSRQEPQLWLSSNGSSLQQLPAPGAFDYVASTGAGFIAFGKDDMGLPIVWMTDDGEAWTSLNLPATSPLSGASVRTFAGFGGSMIAAGSDVAEDRAAIWASDDGAHWDAVPFPAEKGTAITHLVASDDRLVAIGQERRMTGSRVVTSIAAWTTLDGLAWESVGQGSLLADATPSAVSQLDGQLVVAGRLFTGPGPEDAGTSTMWHYAPGPDPAATGAPEDPEGASLAGASSQAEPPSDTAAFEVASGKLQAPERTS